MHREDDRFDRAAAASAPRRRVSAVTKRCTWRSITLTTLMVLGAIPTAAMADPSGRFSAERVVVFGDVHGAYDELTGLLRAARVVDDALHWTAGSTHVVSLGDILDRGQGARPALDLLMRLQSEAIAAGGRLHVVLGNHELMNLLGDLRYVPDAEFAAFAASDPGAHPIADRPAGFAARYDAFAADGSYGSWLLAQPAAVVVNDTAYVHGGLPPVATRLGPEALDQEVKARLRELLHLRTELAAAGVIDARSDIQADALRLKSERAPAGPAPAGPAPAADPPPAFAPRTPEVEAAIARFIELAEDDLFADGGTFWYRGTALCHDLLERPLLEAALANWGVRRVVVGHTPTWDSRVRERFDGRAVLADTGMLYDYYRGRPSALLLEAGNLQVLYADEPARLAVPAPRVGLEFDGLNTAAVEALLETGMLRPAGAATAAAVPTMDALDQDGAPAAPDLQATLPPGTTLVSASAGALSVNALFEPGSRAEVGRQLAAYRLDRLLGLGLVAPVAAREFNGRRGVVSARWQRTVDEQARAAAGVARRNWCAHGNDYQLMYVFDALINNRSRTANTMLYDRRTWQFASAGHAQSFERGRELPAYLANAPRIVPPALADALRRLDEPGLVAALGETLSKAQLRALLQRRDDLLAGWTDGAATP